MIRKNQLNILQYNVRKSKNTVMATLLRDARVADYDIIAIQEPWVNPFMSTTHHPAKDIFHLCYPKTEEEDGPARVCFYINKRLDHTKWQFEQHTRDVCSLKIRFEGEDQLRGQLAIHNVYNPVQSTENRRSALPLLREILGTYELEE